MQASSKKIAFIVQRYGPEINGGAELHCMQLAQKLAQHYQVEVLTTCAVDYIDWADHYPQGTSVINNVTVRRFKVAQLRDGNKMGQIERRLNMKIEKPRKQNFLKNLFKKVLREYILKKGNGTDDDYREWVLAQGPTTPDLINFLRAHQQDYDCLIFFTYLYYPTVFGIDINPRKTIFIPTAHDEWCIYMPVFKKMFSTPACIMYNTLAEKRLVNRIFSNEKVYSEIAGVGVDVPEDSKEIDIKISKGLHQAYVLYVGRIDDNKIRDEDIAFFLRYVNETGKAIQLVLIGNLYKKLPKNKHLIHLGFVDEDSKFNLIRQSLFLFQPSRYESLSMVVLEAFMMERPVLVHADCEVMKDHVDQSKGGFYYNEYDSFKRAVDQLTSGEELNTKMGKAGKAYVEENYKWESVINKFRYVIENKLRQ